MFFRKFWISLILTIPVVLYADVIEKIFKWSPPQFPGSEYMPLVFASFVFFYGGRVFLVGAGREIKARLPGMMTLISIAVSADYLWIIYAVFANEEALFWELTTLITIMLLGHWLEMRAVSGAQGAADGKIINGESNVNESMITGESNPVSKKTSDSVIAGTINGDGALKISVANIGEKTFLAGVMRLVAEVQASKSKLQILSDRAALYLTIVAVAGGIITLVAWLAAGAEINFALEAARTIDTVLFDKTGTLTKGKFGVIEIWNINGYAKNEVLGLAASLDALSEHPILLFRKRLLSPLCLSRLQTFSFLSKRYFAPRLSRQPLLRWVGGPALLESLGIKIPTDLSEKVQKAGEKGQTVIFIVEDQVLLGAIALTDIIREESREAVRSLKDMGIRTTMITGDSEDVAKWVSQDIGIDEYFARVLPHQKSEKVKELQERNLRVAMVGDGINDAPALTQTDLGIAIGAGTSDTILSRYLWPPARWLIKA